MLAGPALAPASLSPALAGSGLALAGPGLAPAGSGLALADATVAPASPALLPACSGCAPACFLPAQARGQGPCGRYATQLCVAYDRQGSGKMQRLRGSPRRRAGRALRGSCGHGSCALDSLCGRMVPTARFPPLISRALSGLCPTVSRSVTYAENPRRRHGFHGRRHTGPRRQGRSCPPGAYEARGLEVCRGRRSGEHQRRVDSRGRITRHCTGPGGRRGPCHSRPRPVPARPLNVSPLGGLLAARN